MHLHSNNFSLAEWKKRKYLCDEKRKGLITN